MRSLTVDNDSPIKQNQIKIGNFEDRSQTDELINRSLIPNKLFKPDNNIFNSFINKIQSSEYANTKEKFHPNTKTLLTQIDRKEFNSDFEEVIIRFFK